MFSHLDLFSQLLLLILSLNPDPVHKDTLQSSNEWNIFKNKGLHYSLLSKIEERRYIAKSTIPAIIGICKSSLNLSVLDPEISSVNYKILHVIETNTEEGLPVT